MRFLTSEQIKALEARLITDTASSLRLINNAANACVKELLPFDAICVFCGKGNNGADGYRIASLLHSLGKSVVTVRVYEPKTEECRLLADECAERGILSLGIDEAEKRLPSCDAAVDAIFGIGISGEIIGEAARAIRLFNSVSAFKLAVDLPSGLNADNGEVCGSCTAADKTVTFTAPKTGMLKNSSVNPCGEILVRDVGISVSWEQIPSSQPLALINPPLPKRPRLSHKGSFGRLLMIVGSSGMLGAGIMAARAALKSGCGLVSIVCKRGCEGFINIAVPEAVVLPVEAYTLEYEPLSSAVKSANAILIGCGLGKSVTADFISAVLNASSAPTVIDADGLNTLCGNTKALKRKNLIITPHPLEFSRLTGLPVPLIEADRLSAARSFAENYALTLVLKGARTVIAEKGGEASVSLAATSALAKGGSGDVLAGIIAALCAQGIPPADCARLGVFLHGRSGLLAAEKCGEYSTTVSDIIENLKYAFMEADTE